MSQVWGLSIPTAYDSSRCRPWRCPSLRATSRHSRVGRVRDPRKKRGQKIPRNFKSRRKCAKKIQWRKVPAPESARRRQGPTKSRRKISKNFIKFRKKHEISKKTRKSAKIGQKTPQKRPFPSRPVQLKSPNFKNFGKNAISGHHLGVFEILARRGVSSLFRFMRNDPSPYRTNKRLSEFNSGL